MALILQHPKAPVTFDPPPADPREQAVADPVEASPQSVRAAWLDSNRERAKAGIEPHPRPLFRVKEMPRTKIHLDEREQDLARSAAIDQLHQMVQDYGAATVHGWLRYAANLRGQELA